MSSINYCSNYYSHRRCRNPPSSRYGGDGECYECSMLANKEGDRIPRSLLWTGSSSGPISSGVPSSANNTKEVKSEKGSMDGHGHEKSANGGGGGSTGGSPAGSERGSSSGSEEGSEAENEKKEIKRA